MIATRPAVLTDRIHVYVAASDPVSRAGIASQLRSHHGLDMVEERQLDGGKRTCGCSDHDGRFDRESVEERRMGMRLCGRRGVHGKRRAEIVEP